MQTIKQNNIVNLLCYFEINNLTGYGHAKRVISFLDIIRKKKISITILTNNLDKNIKRNFYKSKFKMIETSDAKKFLKKNLNKFSHLILDPPYYEKKKAINSGNYWKFLKNGNKNIKILRFTDELIPSKHNVDILINPVSISKNFKRIYLTNAKKIFLGSNYTIPIPIFGDNHKITKNKFKLIIVFGGNDPKSIVFKIWKFFYKLNFKKIFICNDDTFNKLKMYNNSNNIFKKKLSSNNFYRLFNMCEFFFSTASNIMIEGIFLGKKGMVTSIQSRQKKLGYIYNKKNDIIYVGHYNKLNEKKILLSLKRLFSKKTTLRLKKSNLIARYKRIMNEFI